MFNVLIFLSGIVLMRFLVAILCDTCNRVKLKERVELTEGRARMTGALSFTRSIGTDSNYAVLQSLRSLPSLSSTHSVSFSLRSRQRAS